MSKYLEKIGLNAKIAFENKISNKKKNKVLKLKLCQVINLKDVLKSSVIKVYALL